MDTRRLKTASDGGLDSKLRRASTVEQLAQIILILRRTRPVGGGLEECFGVHEAFLFV